MADEATMNEKRRQGLAAVLLDGEQRSAKTYEKIGEFIHQFSQVEFSLRWVLSMLLELTDDEFDVVTSSYDFAKLVTVTKAILKRRTSPEQFAAFDGIWGELLAVNDIRVKIAHGVWADGPDGMSVMTVSKKAFEVEYSFDDPVKIDAAVGRAIGAHVGLISTFMKSQLEPRIKQ